MYIQYVCLWCGLTELSAGVIGLYTALLLARQDKARHVTVIAEYLPGDQSSKFTSPWAGANFSTISGDDEAALEYDRISFKLLNQIVDEFKNDKVITKLPTTELWSEVPSESKLQSLKQYIPDVSMRSMTELIFWTTPPSPSFIHPNLIASCPQ